MFKRKAQRINWNFNIIRNLIVICVVTSLLFSGFIIVGLRPYEASNTKDGITGNRGGPTLVSGYISSDTTWKVTNSPYIVTSDVVVEELKTLTIEPGVTVKFSNGTSLILDGILETVGSKDKKIVFTSNATSPAVSDWKGIRFRESGHNWESIIKWVTVTYAEKGISFDVWVDQKISNLTASFNKYGIYGNTQTHPIVTNSNFFNNTYGIYSKGTAGHNLQVISSSFTNNTYGIFSRGGNPGAYISVRHSILKNNHYGIESVDWSGVVISHCSIISNSADGIITGPKTLSVGSNSNSSITYSNIYNNNGYDLKCNGTTSINATNNYWGTTNKTLIEQHFFDYYDDHEYGKVNYIPYQTSPVNITNLRPIANIGSDQNCYLNQSVTFDASKSYDPDGDNLIYNWDFGDGYFSDKDQDGIPDYIEGVSEPIIVGHSYSAIGNYTVKLTVSDGELIDIDTCIVRVSSAVLNHPPVANAGANQTVKVNQTVRFNGCDSYDPDWDLLKYNWSFGDGTSSGWTYDCKSIHTYTIATKYTVTLYVKDGEFISTDTCIILVIIKESGIEPTENDTDGDGLNNDIEIIFLTDQNDIDTDDDGVLDGNESLDISKTKDSPYNDPDRDGWNNAMDADSDGDGILDGTEKGLTQADIFMSATDIAKGRFFPDADPLTTTDMTKYDTDGDTWSDGDEDRNANGKYEPELGEKDPNFKDYDNDGLHDDSEDTDDDNDGMPDDFEEKFPNACNPLDPSDANEDYDNDGYTNYHEYLGKDNKPGNNDYTDPEDAASYPPKDIDQDSDGDLIPDRIDAFPNDPNEWADSDDDGYGDNSDKFDRDETQWNDTDGDGYGDHPEGNNPDDFPFDPTEWCDLDGDGVGDNSDADPSDPENREVIIIDTDGDGLADSWEIFYGLDPSNFSDSLIDSDGDSLTNLREFEIGTNPMNKDTDGDGYSDKIDAFPINPDYYLKPDGNGEPGIELFSIIIIISGMLLIIIAIFTSFMVKSKHRRTIKPYNDDRLIRKVRDEIIHGKSTSDLEISSAELSALLERNYQTRGISKNTYNYINDENLISNHVDEERIKK